MGADVIITSNRRIKLFPYLTSELGEAANLAARDVRICIVCRTVRYWCRFRRSILQRWWREKRVVSIGDFPRDLEVEIPLRLTLFAGNG